MMKKISKIFQRAFAEAKKNSGYTLLEIMIVITIIAILAGIFVPKFMSKPQETKVSAAKLQFRSFQTVLLDYSMKKGTYPSTEEGLQALVNEGYLKNKDLNDPWGHPYQYRSPGEVDKEFEIWSLGADGKEGGDGFDTDIKSWE